MFHVKHRLLSNRRAGLAGLVAVLLALLASGCFGTDIGNPDGWASPVQVGDLIVVQEKRGELAAIRLGATDNPFTESDERIAWRFPGDDDDVDLDAVYANPIVDGDVMYLAAYSGDVLALDISVDPPRALWLRTFPDPIVATPAFDGRTLYIATEGGDVVPIEASSGAVELPLARADDRIWSRPALDGGSLYIPALDGQVRAVGLASGDEQWASSLSGAVPGDPAIADELLLVGSFDRKLHALDTATGDEEWTFQGDGWFWAQPLVVGGTVYAATTRGSVYALSLEGGDDARRKWRFNGLDSEIRVRPVLRDGVLIVAAEEGMIFGIDPATGDTLWTTPLLGRRFLADPLVLDSSIIYATTRGDLIELDPQSGLATAVYERS